MIRPLPSSTGRPLVIAHRGAKAYKPENTLAAYALAVAQGADMVEIDIHLARDESMPISHDAALERFGQAGEIAEVSLDELRAMSASAFAARGSDKAYEEIPVLNEVLDQFGDVIPFNLEIKTMTDERPYAGLQKMIVDQVVERGLLEQTLFSSFSDPVLRELRDLCPKARLGVLVDPRAPAGIFERADVIDAESINPHFVNTNAGLVEEAHQKGLAVYVYTVDEPAQMRELFALGVDGIFSNVPDLLREVVASLTNQA